MTGSVRVQWNEIPDGIVRRIEAGSGSRVVSAVSQRGGFSDGSADRVTFADGSRVFVKTLSAQRNPGGYELHRREAGVMRMLPARTPAPRLLDDFALDGWAVVVIEDVPGRHPEPSDTGRVLDMYAELRTVTSPRGLPTLAEDLSGDAGAWTTLEVDGALPDGWTRDHLERLDRAARAVADAVAGDELVHLDGRADNILLADDGRTLLVDWPWAVSGVGWMDPLAYLIDQRRMNPLFDVDSSLRHPVFTGARAEAVDAVLSVLAGSWLDRARTPAPATMPTIRAFQRSEADAALSILRERWS